MATYYLTRSPMYDAGFAILKDEDGVLQFASEYEDPPVLGTLSRVITPIEATPNPVVGETIGSHEAFVAQGASGSSTGSSAASATASEGFSVSGSATGEATHSATAAAERNLEATADIVFTAEGVLIESSPIGDTPGIRYPWSPIEDLTPGDRLEVGCLSDLSVNNRVGILDSATLKRDPMYSGPDYVLGGPPDDSASPKQLGIKAGEQLVLTGPSGGETHDGRRLTLQDPNSWSVYEVLDPADTTWYQFRVIRSVN